MFLIILYNPTEISKLHTSESSIDDYCYYVVHISYPY